MGLFDLSGLEPASDGVASPFSGSHCFTSLSAHLSHPYVRSRGHWLLAVLQGLVSLAPDNMLLTDCALCFSSLLYILLPRPAY